ncbi:MAG: hypothetical protein R3D00_05685 [Bacteroidia bacterium]
MATLGISSLQLVIFSVILLIVILGVIFIVSDNRAYQKRMKERSLSRKVKKTQKESEVV